MTPGLGLHKSLHSEEHATLTDLLAASSLVRYQMTNHRPHGVQYATPLNLAVPRDREQGTDEANATKQLASLKRRVRRTLASLTSQSYFLSGPQRLHSQSSVARMGGLYPLRLVSPGPFSITDDRPSTLPYTAPPFLLWLTIIDPVSLTNADKNRPAQYRIESWRRLSLRDKIC